MPATNLQGPMCFLMQNKSFELEGCIFASFLSAPNPHSPPPPVAFLYRVASQ